MNKYINTPIPNLYAPSHHPHPSMGVRCHYNNNLTIIQLFTTKPVQD